MSASTANFYNGRLCGCWIPVKPTSTEYSAEQRYLPQVELSASTKILETASRTILRQTFVNPQAQALEEVHYSFPLYDGVSIVGFSYTVGPKKVVGIVKEKQQARLEYQEAVDRGETGALLEQLPLASDVFTTSIGNIPTNETIHIEVDYLGELKHDAETDGTRFTIPTAIAPRYGDFSVDGAGVIPSLNTVDKGGISISVDVILEEGSVIRGLQSPSHPIAVTIGRTSRMDNHTVRPNQASATLTLGTAGFDTDFVLVILRTESEIPRALLESHPSIPNQRALMTTLVPRFSIPNIYPEIVFVVDRSGSMYGNIALVVAAMKVFLKSLPLGVKFNVCSFGDRYSFMFKKSRTYDQSSLVEALDHIETFEADYGGTCLLDPIQETIQRRFKDLPLEVMVLTDGEIWNQDDVFTYVNGTENARFFTLGIGSGASSALVEGIARAGNGFAQFVSDGERMDKRVVRMLKGALTPHVSDYTLHVTYEPEEPTVAEDDFEMVDAVKDTAQVVGSVPVHTPTKQKTISLFDPTAVEEPPNPPAGRYDSLPAISAPQILQTPYRIPVLFPFNRTTVYLLLDSEAPRKTPKSVLLRGTSDHGLLELEIPVQDIGAGETIHQLAAKKAMQELEEGRGWLTEARNSEGQLLKSIHEGRWDLLVEREAVRLGTLFQVGGKWCSFVAIDVDKDGSERDLDFVLPVRPSKSTTDSDLASFALPTPSSSFPVAKYRKSLQRSPSAAGGSVRVAHRHRHVPPHSRGEASCSSVFENPLHTITAPSSRGKTGNLFRPSYVSQSISSFSANDADNRLPGRGPGGHLGGSIAHGGPPAPTPFVSHPAPLPRARLGLVRQAPLAMAAKPPPPPPFAATNSGNSQPKPDLDLSSLPDTVKMRKIIDLQEFDGSWHISGTLLRLLGVTDEQVTSLNLDWNGTTGNANVPERPAGDEDARLELPLKATALAVAWFRAKAANEEDVWELVVEKALGWLRAQGDNADARVDKMVDDCRQCLPG
ncbi:hypothetical protein A1O3_06398 [Capronia epimyces CBS 606.96]|uniref:VIT domain-containing protein n=1 Tax=Capronia epimyces CBS 606.96 TaxID=1182542 RepID=W9XYY2_9EURO|nr:uncharacterized protein A1O3_06398 [Capronia epimyces CBS 606.96]EXJ82585.1 hypothetical protein A1O3_06398 [Capronia epimyces CBS 606.96]